MTALDIKEAWKPYESLLPTSDVARAILRAVTTLGETPVAIFPSVVVAPDGLQVGSIFLVTPSFFSEIAPNGTTFDLIDRRRVLHMRWIYGRTTVQNDAEASKEYETVTLELSHGITVSQIHFVGTSSEAEAWIGVVSPVFPSALVLNAW